MFESYKLTNNILYLNISMDMEFSIDFDKISKKKSEFVTKIIDFIKLNNIKFKNQKIAIVSGGIVIATFLIPISNFYNNDITNINKSSNIYEKYFYVNEESIFNNQTNDSNSVIENIINEENVIKEKEEVEKIPDNSNINTVTSNNPNKNTSTSNNNSNNNENNNTTTTKPPEKEVIEETYDYKITLHRSNGQIIEMELEDYVIGVVGAEMPASFNIEALKAQAILARTYAIKTLETGKKLTDTTIKQVYKDNKELNTMWGSSYNTYYNKIKSSVTSTKGLVVIYNNQLIDAVYHSTSNGRTENPVYVWGYDIPYLQSVSSTYDEVATSYYRETTRDFNILSTIFGINFNSDTIIEVIDYTSSGAVNKINIGGKIYTGKEIREILGLRSTDFKFILQDSGYIISTKGYGHGVGMSQYGANGMAKSGSTYTQILNHYYTNVKIVQNS
ncbi:MAG: stage II sporulation protein D [Bacilli bacterium]